MATAEGKVYHVIAENGAWLYGQFHPSGSLLRMSEAQAEHLLRAAVISEKVPAAPAPATPPPVTIKPRLGRRRKGM